MKKQILIPSVVGLFLLFFCIYMAPRAYQETIPSTTAMPPIYEVRGEVGESSQVFCGKGEAILRGACWGVGHVSSMPAHSKGRLGWRCRSSKEARAVVRCFGPRKRGWSEVVEKLIVSSASEDNSRRMTWDWYEIRNRIDGCLDEIDDSE